MQRIRQLLTLIALALSIAIGSKAQEALLTERYNVSYLDLGNGLPHNNVSAIFVDSNGFLWIGTYGGGLVRYDGYSMMSPIVKLNSNSCKSITEDRFKRLWVAYDEGTNVIDLKTMSGAVTPQLPEQYQGLLSEPCTKVQCDALGRIWLVTNTHVNLITFGNEGDIVRISSYQYHENTPDISIRDIEGNGKPWIGIEGDIKGCFENIDHDILLEILIRQIKDNQFISLIDKFLKAGHIERGMYFPSKRGTPQGGIISPVLANIYLNELDRYIEELTNNNNEGMLKYIRYADDFLIGVNGTKEDCENLKKSIAGFIAEKLRLELSQEKTLITPSTEKIRFLGYDIWRNPENDKLEMTVPEEISKAMRRGIRMTQKCKPFVTTRIMAERLQNGVCEICGRKEILIMRQIISRKTLSQSGKLHKMTNENCDMNIAICPKCNYSMDLR